MAEHGFAADDVEKISIEGHERLANRHDIREPADIMQAQYSVPFCVALALHRDPEDPRSFDETALSDSFIRTSCRRVQISTRPGGSVKSTRIAVKLRDGRDLIRERDTYKGMPSDPFSRAELRAKYLLLTRHLGEPLAASLFDRLEKIEQVERLQLS